MNAFNQKRLQMIVEQRLKAEQLSKGMQTFRAEGAALWYLSQVVKECPSLSLLVRTESMGLFMIDPGGAGGLLGAGAAAMGQEIITYQGGAT